jgi:hypothetical protein
MKTIRIVATLTYDDALTHGDDPEAVKWFHLDVLGGDLALYSHVLGDSVGDLEIISAGGDE